jgi:hypothetical protein
MLVTLTTTHRPATDLGFQLHKHPDKYHEFSPPFGTAHVFYPEADKARGTFSHSLDPLRTLTWQVTRVEGREPIRKPKAPTPRIGQRIFGLERAAI